jgi:hypothetical protein
MAFRLSIGHLQRDGRRYVTETHSDSFGDYSNITYLSPPNTDITDFNRIATSREPDLIRQNANNEARDDVDSRKRPTARFQTVAEELLQIRERYLKSKGEETCKIARWIVDRLDDGSVTVVQMRTAFNVTPAQWNSINGRMDTFSAAITSVETAVGE